MKDMQLAAMIPRRKSVRSYNQAPLGPDVLADVLSFAGHAVPLFPKVRMAFRILSRDEIHCVCPLSAPHYLALYAERSPDGDLNSGFIMQQVDLYLSSRGIGSCWLGLASAAERFFENLPLVILLSFGTSDEPVHRTSVEQFSRKSVGEMSAAGTVPDFINAIRLAPSAMNKQPWFFSGDAHSCHAFSIPGKRLFNIAEGWRFLDLGIALAHLYLAATAAGKTVSFRREDSIPSGSNTEYVISCRLTD